MLLYSANRLVTGFEIFRKECESGRGGPGGEMLGCLTRPEESAGGSMICCTALGTHPMIN